MPSKLNLKFYFASPVEVVRVTPKNLAEVAAWCGGKVASTESRRVKGQIDSYVWVPTPKGPSISWAFPGMYVTKRLAVSEQGEIKETYSVFRKDYFTKNFFESPTESVDATWVRLDNERKAAARKARTITIELPEGADIEETKERIAAVVVKEPEITDVDVEDQLPDSMVEQREVLREDAVEEEAS